MKSYYCYFNELISLKGCSKIIEYSFDCSMNHLKRFEHNFNKVINFNCEFNKLESLEGGPKIVNGFFNLSNKNFIDKLKTYKIECEYNDLKNSLTPSTKVEQKRTMKI